ncbi:uncharacterized protein METZ01_LOCUS247538 [marine metagenome]|uniref:LamG-like jellyroll fold domain-containing protein n=1 Tax=marine metagenome TaxID=408172 RepID=A0A382I4R4_9ZZZZ
MRILRYVNNKRVTKNKGVPDETNGYNSGTVRLGGWRHLGPRSFKGLIDEVAIFNVALPADTLKDILSRSCVMHPDPLYLPSLNLRQSGYSLRCQPSDSWYNWRELIKDIC